MRIEDYEEITANLRQLRGIRDSYKLKVAYNIGTRSWTGRPTGYENNRALASRLILSERKSVGQEIIHSNADNRKAKNR